MWKNAAKKVLYSLSDKNYLKIMYFISHKQVLNLRNPKKFSEKLQWLKLYDRNPLYKSLVDKCEVKNYVKSRIGEKYVIPTYGVYESTDQINFNNLPSLFVIKPTHLGGGIGVCLCNKKKGVDECEVRQILKQSMSQEIFTTTREWPYKGLKPRIIAEKMLVDDSKDGLKDYKIFCCNGKPKLVKVNYKYYGNYASNWYSPDWHYVEGTTIYDPSHANYWISPPKHLEEMLSLSTELSSGFTFMRVDFYETDEGVFFGEITFYPGSGFEKFIPLSFDLEIGSWIELPKR